MMYWVLSKKLMWHLLLDGVKHEFYTPFLPNSDSFYFLRKQTLFINILKTLFFLLANLETNILFGCKGDEKESSEEKVREGKGKKRELYVEGLH